MKDASENFKCRLCTAKLDGEGSSANLKCKFYKKIADLFINCIYMSGEITINGKQYDICKRKKKVKK